MQPTTNESQLGASYLNNCIHQVVQNTSISMCSSNSYAHENLTNDKIYTTFKEIFSNINLDSVSELSPKFQSYNKEIAKFIQVMNRKYGIKLDYTVLEISKVPHWAELGKTEHSTRSSTTQVLIQGLAEMPHFSVPAPTVVNR